jgi:hypothetical protein
MMGIRGFLNDLAASNIVFLVRESFGALGIDVEGGGGEGVVLGLFFIVLLNLGLVIYLMVTF